MNPRIETAVAAMHLLANGHATGQLDVLGVSEEDWRVATGETPWTGADRSRVEQVMKSLIYGTVDVIGMPRHEVPAEFVAAVISVFIAPCNAMVACGIMDAHITAQQMVAGETGAAPHGVAPVTAPRLFAMVIELLSDHRTGQAMHQFVKRTNRAIQRSNQDGQEPKSKK